MFYQCWAKSEITSWYITVVYDRLMKIITNPRPIVGNVENLGSNIVVIVTNLCFKLSINYMILLRDGTYQPNYVK